MPYILLWVSWVDGTRRFYWNSLLHIFHLASNRRNARPYQLPRPVSTFNLQLILYRNIHLRDIQAETKWRQISWRQFQMNFLERKYISFEWDFLKFVSMGPIDNIPALVEIMAWCCPALISFTLELTLANTFGSYISHTDNTEIIYSRTSAIKNISSTSQKHVNMVRLLWFIVATPIAKLMGQTWGTPGADRTQLGPMLATWTLLSR